MVEKAHKVWLWLTDGCFWRFMEIYGQTLPANRGLEKIKCSHVLQVRAEPTVTAGLCGHEFSR